MWCLETINALNQEVAKGKTYQEAEDVLGIVRQGIPSTILVPEKEVLDKDTAEMVQTVFDHRRTKKIA